MSNDMGICGMPQTIRRHCWGIDILSAENVVSPLKYVPTSRLVLYCLAPYSLFLLFGSALVQL